MSRKKNFLHRFLVTAFCLFILSGVVTAQDSTLTPSPLPGESGHLLYEDFRTAGDYGDKAPYFFNWKTGNPQPLPSVEGSDTSAYGYWAIDDNRVFTDLCYRTSIGCYGGAQRPGVFSKEDIPKLENLYDTYTGTSLLLSPDLRSVLMLSGDFFLGDEMHLMDIDGSHLRDPIPGSQKDGVSFAWTPDSQHIAFVGSGQLKFLDLADNQVHPITGLSETIRWFALSPDGRQIAFVTFESGTIYRINTDGTNLIKIPNIRSSFPALAWSPDSSKIAIAPDNDVIKGDGIFVVNRDGTDLRQVTTLHFYSTMAWSPDSKDIAFYAQGDRASGDGFYFHEYLYVVDADGSAPPQRLLEDLSLEVSDPGYPVLLWLN